jgi:hypothetical protein
MIRRMGLLAIALMTSSVGCATSFTGNAHVTGGRNGCEAKCRGQGMLTAGMVFMGEYSSACVCELPRATAGSTQHMNMVTDSGGASGAVAGVIMQMQEQQRQSQRH